jgi:hypothetical protein
METTPTGLLQYQGTVHIKFGVNSQSFFCKMYFDLARRNSLLIDLPDSIHAIFSGTESGSFWLTFPQVQDPVECYASSWQIGARGNQFGVYAKLAPRPSAIEVDNSQSLVRVNAGVLNLGHYFTGAPGGSYFTISYQDWRFEFTPVGEPIMLYDPTIQNEEFFFTHHLTLTKASGADFSPSQAHDRLSDLSTFFSFCHGYWVGTALAYGINKDGTVGMEEWGTRRVSRWRSGSNWLDEQHGKCMEELYPLFMHLMSRSGDWREIIEHTVYWYVRADTDLIGPDGACVLLQATLERLAWHVLVRERRSLSKDGFSKLPASDQLRLLLASLSIPLEIPSELVQLQKAAKAFSWPDGPEAFVGIRNRIVHPPKKPSQTNKLPYYDAYLLAKWYVELAVLSACGYKGVYSKQTKHRWTGQVEAVPWAQ